MPSKEFGTLNLITDPAFRPEHDAELTRLARETERCYRIEEQARQAAISLEIARGTIRRGDTDSTRALRADAATRLVGIQTVLPSLLESLRS